VQTQSVVALKAAIPNKGVARLVQEHALELFDGIAFEFAEADGPGAAVMPRMLNELAYDLCDMSPSSFLIARERGVPISRDDLLRLSVRRDRRAAGRRDRNAE
jgi:hypothetical protein